MNYLMFGFAICDKIDRDGSTLLVCLDMQTSDGVLLICVRFSGEWRSYPQSLFEGSIIRTYAKERSLETLTVTEYRERMGLQMHVHVCRCCGKPAFHWVQRGKSRDWYCRKCLALLRRGLDDPQARIRYPRDLLVEVI